MTWTMEANEANTVAIRFLTVGEFFCRGRSTRTTRTVLKPPREMPFGSTSMSMTMMKTKSRQFHPPSSDAEKKGGLPWGNSVVFGLTPDWERIPKANMRSPTSVAKKMRRD